MKHCAGDPHLRGTYKEGWLGKGRWVRRKLRGKFSLSLDLAAMLALTTRLLELILNMSWLQLLPIDWLID